MNGLSVSTLNWIEVSYLFLLWAWSQSSQPPCATISSKYVQEQTILEYCPIARPTYSGPVPVTLHRTNANPVFSSGCFLSWAAMEPNLVAIECSSQSCTKPNQNTFLILHSAIVVGLEMESRKPGTQKLNMFSFFWQH